MYLYASLNPPPDIRYLGTSLKEHGIWYWPGPGVSLLLPFPLVWDPNLDRVFIFEYYLYKGPENVDLELYIPGPGTPPLDKLR